MSKFTDDFINDFDKQVAELFQVKYDTVIIPEIVRLAKVIKSYSKYNVRLNKIEFGMGQATLMGTLDFPIETEEETKEGVTVTMEIAPFEFYQLMYDHPYEIFHAIPELSKLQAILDNLRYDGEFGRYVSGKDIDLSNV